MGHNASYTLIKHISRKLLKIAIMWYHNEVKKLNKSALIYFSLISRVLDFLN